MLKNQLGAERAGVKLNAGQHLLASATSGVITAFLTNPLWVVKTRMYTTSRSQEAAYRNMFDGLYQITRKEGLPGLYKGTIMAVVGVSNGAIQFMAYEELKKIVRERKLRRSVGESEAVELYQDLNIVPGKPPPLPYKSIRDVVRRTYRQEGLTAFYKGLGPNIIRILPGTSVTFVVYENCSVRDS
ncbi:mitochondrial FAD carrier protein flx1 [Cystobasidiomycetes sp. EMM_F5]